MSRTDPKIFRGIGGITVYNRDDRVPIVNLRVLSEASLNFKPEYEELKIGGKVWDSEVKESSVELSYTVSEYPKKHLEVLSAATASDHTVTASGEIALLENVNGDSVYKATTGIASVSIGTVTDLKEGEYVVKAVSATTVDVYALSDVSFGDGTDGAVIDDTMVIAQGLSITQSSETAIPKFGISLVGGSGTIAMTVGDTCHFTVRRASSTGYTLKVGSQLDSFGEYGVLLIPRKKGTSYRFIDVFRCQIAGLPISLKDGYSEAQITVKALYDSAKDGYFRIVDSVL